MRPDTTSQIAISDSVTERVLERAERNEQTAPRRRERLQEAANRAWKLHEPGYYPGRVTLFVASDGVVVGRRDRALGWAGFCAEVDIEPVPGDHISILQDPFVQVLAQKLSARLEAARDGDRRAGGAGA